MDTTRLESIMVDQIASLLRNDEPVIARSQALQPNLKHKEITIITGVRRCGKSSLVKALIRELPNPNGIIYLNFDDPRLNNFKAEEFETLYEIWLRKEPTVATKIAIFDEIQNIAGWERWMNFFTDQKMFKVFITGSNSKLLSSEFATHLTGRHEDIVLYPLSFKEVLQNDDVGLAKKASDLSQVLTLEETGALTRCFAKYFEIGGFPRVWLSRDKSLLGEYYNDILYRDIVRRHKLRHVALIAGFGASVMSDLGRKLNKVRLASAIGVKEAKTISAYFGYFAECYLGAEIRRFDVSVRKQLRSLAKFYAIDPVLAQRIGIHSESKDGFYLETFVFIELSRRHRGQVFYWDVGQSSITKKGSTKKLKPSEVDFVVKTNTGYRLVQVAWSIANKETLVRELTGFEQFCAAFPELKIISKTIITVEETIGLTLSHDVQAVSFLRWALAEDSLT